MRIGIDMISIPRFAGIAANPRLRSALFTPAELAEIAGLCDRRRAERLAGRFGVKEAACKVLGRGFGQPFHWHDIEVLADAWGAPRVVLHGGALRLSQEAGLGDIAVTITHHADLAVAMAAAG